MLKSQGYSEQDINMGWSLGQGPLSNIRDARVQEILLREWRHSEAEKKIKSSKFRSLPNVLKPNDRRGNGAVSDESELRRLHQATKHGGSLKEVTAYNRPSKPTEREGKI